MLYTDKEAKDNSSKVKSVIPYPLSEQVSDMLITNESLYGIYWNIIINIKVDSHY